MGMSPKLLRPRQTLHPEAAAWKTAVVANGGSVSGTTLSAVDKFCKAIASSGIRDRFYRLNLFCGTGLNACLVPLYRGPSPGGTQYGNSIDTNVGPFVSGDYSESGGLNASLNSTKYLDTGLSTSALPASVYESAHLSAWHGAMPDIVTDPFLLGANNGSTDRFNLQSSIRTTAAVGESVRLGKATGVTAGTLIQGARPATSLIGSRTSATSLVLYRNGVADATQTTSATGIAGNEFPFYVFRINSTGSVLGDMPGFSMFSYSIGDDLTASQAASLHSALAAFHASIGRSV